LEIPKKIGKPGHKERADIKILISSAAGGIGTHLIEYLIKLGYKSIYGIAGSDEKCEFV
jgi:NADPH-dependent curcumin reductase CurA